MEKEDTSGKLLFQLAEDCGIGEMDIYVNETWIGTLNTYRSDGGPFCGDAFSSDEVSTTLPLGTNTIRVVGQSTGAELTDEVFISSNSNCTPFRIFCSRFTATGNGSGNGGGGNGAGGTSPGRIIFQRNEDCQVGWVEYYINDQLLERSSYYWPNGGPYCNSPEDEDYVIAYVDPGTYTLKTVSQAEGSFSSDVTVTSNGCVEYPVTCTMLTNGSGGSGSGGSCDWGSATQFITVVEAVKGSRCGSDNSVEVAVRNDSNGYIKAGICLQRADLSWDSNVDGTFNTGMAPGATVNWYLCEGTGNYKIWAMSAADYLDNDCRYPTDAQCE